MKISIIGGGIGGLTTAIALQQQGFECHVYEGATKLSEVGAGIWLGANAQNVLDVIGVGEQIRKRSHELQKVYIKGYDQSVISEMKWGELKEQFGNGLYAVHRAVLQEELAKAVGSANISLGYRLSGIKQDTHGYMLDFENQKQLRADLVIGADGIRSQVRESYIGNAEYRYSGQTCYRTMLDLRLPHEEINTGAEVWGIPGGVRASFSQCGEDKVYFWFTMKDKAGEKRSNEAALEIIKERLEPFKGYMSEVVSRIEPDKLIHSDLWDIKALPAWYKEQVVLIGDAAHATNPNLGQGASQAIEDAHALALMLKEYHTVGDALAAYQEARYDRAKYIVDTSYQLAKLTNWGGRIPYILKKWIMRATPKSVMKKQLQRVYVNPLIN
jgi:2-polyprenyl-6-methoxyphenol hydroxylase-like FAD-dependent oxidoreductase